MAQVLHQSRMREVWGPQWFIFRGWEGACACVALSPGRSQALSTIPIWSPHKSMWLCLELSQEALIGGISDRKSRAGGLVNT